MLSVFVSSMTSKGQITIHRDLRRRLGLDKGSFIVMSIRGKELRLKKGVIREDDDDGFSDAEWEMLRKLALGKGRTYDNGRKFLKSLK